MIYKIIFAIVIFLLNMLIIKDEIPNYSKESNIMKGSEYYEKTVRT